MPFRTPHGICDCLSCFGTAFFCHLSHHCSVGLAGRLHPLGCFSCRFGEEGTSQAPWDALRDAPAHLQVKQGKTSAATPRADEKSFVMLPKGLLSENHLLLPRIPPSSFSPFLCLQIRVAVLSCVFRVCSTCRLSRS